MFECTEWLLPRCKYHSLAERCRLSDSSPCFTAHRSDVGCSFNTPQRQINTFFFFLIQLSRSNFFSLPLNSGQVAVDRRSGAWWRGDFTPTRRGINGRTGPLLGSNIHKEPPGKREKNPRGFLFRTIPSFLSEGSPAARRTAAVLSPLCTKWQPCCLSAGREAGRQQPGSPAAVLAGCECVRV